MPKKKTTRTPLIEEFSAPLFESKVLVFHGTGDQLNDHLIDRFEWKGDLPPLSVSTMAAHLRLLVNDRYLHVLYFSEDPASTEVPIIVHEVSHLAQRILEHLEIPICDETSEIFALLMEQLTSRVLEAVGPDTI